MYNALPLVLKGCIALLAHYREHLLKEGGTIERLSNLRMRFVVRPTHLDVKFSYRMTDPCFMRNQQEADQEIDRLVKHFLTRQSTIFICFWRRKKGPSKPRDIPVFYFVPTKTTFLPTDQPKGTMQASLKTVCKWPLRKVYLKKRIRDMNLADCQKQVNSIHHAFYAVKARPSSDMSRYRYCPSYRWISSGDQDSASIPNCWNAQRILLVF